MSEASSLENENSKVNFSGARIQNLTIAMNDLVSNGANIKGSSKVDRPSVSHYVGQQSEEAWKSADTPKVSTTQNPQIPSTLVETASQILRYDKKSGKFVFYKELFEEIIEENRVGHLPVVFISVVGPFRTGKSFLLNLMSRYFAAEDKNSWLGEENEPVDLKEFSFKSGPSRETTGMYVSRRIHVVRNVDGEEVGIVLADTQGLFDSLTTQKEASTIFSLSTMISSMLLYNLKGNVDSSNLESLTTFLEYAKYTTSSFQEKPFDNIHILVRDWEWPEDYVYGRHGGKRYIESWLNDENSPDHLKKIAESVKCSFEHIYCYLLPEPGRMLKRSSSDAKLTAAEMGVDFIRHVKDTIKALSKNLVTKKFNQVKITFLELVNLIDDYVNLYNETDVPDPSLQVDIWAKFYYKKIIKKLNDNFVTTVESKLVTIDSAESLSSVVEVCKSQIFNEFNAIPTYSEHEKKLCEEKVNENIYSQHEKLRGQLEKDLNYVESELTNVDKQVERLVSEYAQNIEANIGNGIINCVERLDAQHASLKKQAEDNFSFFFKDVQDRAWSTIFSKLEKFRSESEKVKRNGLLQNRIDEFFNGNKQNLLNKIPKEYKPSTWVRNRDKVTKPFKKLF